MKKIANNFLGNMTTSSATIPDKLDSQSSTNYVNLNTSLVVDAINPAINAVLSRIATVHEQCVIKILFQYGLRVSEVLSLKFSDHIANGLYNVNTKKHGIPTRIYLHNFLPPTPKNMKNANNTIFYGTNYSRIYKIMKILGFRLRDKNRKNQSVTHFPRKMFARKIYGKFGQETASAGLNHASKKSINYYLEV